VIGGKPAHGHSGGLSDRGNSLVIAHHARTGIWVILLLTWLIALGGFAHVVAGSGEAWLLMLDGRITAFQAVFDIIVPTLLGNVLGARACSRCWPMRRCAASCDSPMERWRRRTIP
jgi:hypothetical protein